MGLHRCSDRDCVISVSYLYVVGYNWGRKPCWWSGWSKSNIIAQVFLMESQQSFRGSNHKSRQTDTLSSLRQGTAITPRVSWTMVVRTVTTGRHRRTVAITVRTWTVIRATSIGTTTTVLTVTRCAPSGNYDVHDTCVGWLQNKALIFYRLHSNMIAWR